MARARFTLAVVAALVPGCQGVPSAPPSQARPVLNVSIDGSRKVDVLFVVDNSASIGEELPLVAAAYEVFFEQLASSELGLPDVHVGAITTDLGAGGYNISGCDGSGDGGVLQNQPQVEGCLAPDERFLVDVAEPDGTRRTNYSGTLAEAVACIAPNVFNGCNFEQPLQAMRRALDGSNAENDGFLRPDALLAIVMITDEDDCSARDSTVFDTSQWGLDDPLGPLAQYRCFEFGVTCEDDEPRTVGPKTGCVANEDSQYLYGVSEYVDFLADVKAQPLQVLVAAVIAEPEPVEVFFDEQRGYFELEDTCSDTETHARPAPRIVDFLAQLGPPSSHRPMCDSSLPTALGEIALDIDRALSSPCLVGELSESPQCTVTETSAAGSTELPVCDSWDEPGSSTIVPCFVLFRDPVTCQHTASGLRLATFPLDRSIRAGSRLLVYCR